MIFAVLFFAVAVSLLALAARNDWRGMQIPNKYPVALLALFLFGLIVPREYFGGITLLGGLFAGALVFAVTFFFYAIKAMGAGDTKLASATAFLVGMSHLGVFLMGMAVTGGALAAYALLVRRHPRFLPVTSDISSNAWLSQLKNGANKIPYGIAIAAGGLAALFLRWITPLF